MQEQPRIFEHSSASIHEFLVPATENGVCFLSSSYSRTTLRFRFYRVINGVGAECTQWKEEPRDTAEYMVSGRGWLCAV